jgi:hypothetical protein
VYVRKKGGNHLSNIYDYFTKKQFDQISHQDYAENERVIEAYGKYIGVLTRQQAQALRNTMDILVAMQADQVHICV